MRHSLTDAAILSLVQHRWHWTPNSASAYCRVNFHPDFEVYLVCEAYYIVEDGKPVWKCSYSADLRREALNFPHPHKVVRIGELIDLLCALSVDDGKKSRSLVWRALENVLNLPDPDTMRVSGS